MANYYAVFDEQRSGLAIEPGTKYKSAATLDNVMVAKVLKLEAGSIAEAQKAVQFLLPGDEPKTTVVVEESAWKES